MKVKLYYYWQQYSSQSYEEGKVVVHTYPHGLPIWDELTFIKELEVDLPDCDPPTKQEVINGMVATLKQEKQKLQAEVEIKLQRIDDKIRQLSALEYKPEPAMPELKRVNPYYFDDIPF